MTEARPEQDLLPSTFFAFRTALLPWDALETWVANLVAPTASKEDLGAALTADRSLLRRRLQTFIEQPEIREALFLASPDLDEAIPHWLNDPDSDKGIRAERTLVRYFARMAGRSTPFGLFAGCSLGRLGEATRLALGPRSSYIRHTRLDMDYLCTLTEVLGTGAELRESLHYRPNSSIYRAGGRLRYAESKLQKKSRSYHLVAVEETDYLARVLNQAEAGSTLSELAGLLVDDDISFEEAKAFIDELVASQLLVSDLQPPVTGPEPIHALIPQLAAQPAGAEAARILSAVRDSLIAIDSQGLGLGSKPYRAIAADLGSLPAKVEMHRLFQVDMVKPVPDAILSTKVVDEIRRGVESLHRMTPRPAKDALSAFREAFQNRYESQELPLMEVLDEEGGIGFQTSQQPGAEASPLLEGLGFPGGAVENQVAWGAREVLLLRKLLELERSGGGVLRLQDADLESLKAKDPYPLPHSLAVIAELAGESEEALESGAFKVYFKGASGPSGANLLGRFCHGDAALTEAVAGMLQEEEAEQPGAIFAEVVHLPEGRIGNVILRPLLRPYEIPFLGRSGAPEENQIPVTDLLVSIRDGRVVLRSRRLGKEIVPRLTNAHNFSNHSLGVYRFLCTLQYQHVTGGLGWSWGPLESLPHLPRVEYGRLVLAKAQWRVEKAELKSAQDAKGAGQWTALQAWRSERRLPRWVLLADGDNKLPVDLDNVLCCETLLDTVKQRPAFMLEEIFPSPAELLAHGPEGRFVHELVIPFSAKKKVSTAERMPPSSMGTSTQQRSFPPGSEWIYLKLYAGASGVDELLRALVTPLLDEALASGAVDGWFFIRYADPDWHLRLRLHGDPQRLMAEVAQRLQALAEPLRAQGTLWKLQMDTYEREVERYGAGEAMGLAEQVFQADSAAVLGILKYYEGEAGFDVRWRLAFLGMDLLLTDLGFSLDAKYALVQGLRDSFLQEFNGKGPLEYQLGDRFRKERRALENLLDPLKEAGPLQTGVELLRHRSKQLEPIMARLRELAGSPGVPSLESLAGSYLHMHANRLLRASARAQELVLYDFLARIYQSRLARDRKSKPILLEEVAPSNWVSIDERR